MPFTFPLSPQELIAERTAQWVSLGVERPVIDEAAARIVDLWEDGPGGWPFEWSAVAARREREGDLLGSSLLYGIAKFPVLGNTAHRRAYEKQLSTYLHAAPGFGIGFERHEVEVPFRDGRPRVATHVFIPESLPADAPIVLALSGTDTWKMELHAFATVAARVLGARVATVDMAGTGESEVANGPDGDLYLVGVLDWLRQRYPQARRMGAVGFSFGGHWTTKLALTRQVDAAINVGGPLATAFDAEVLGRLRFGMPGIAGNSFGLDQEPSPLDFAAAMAAFSLRAQGLLDDWGTDPVPLLSINGDQDPHVPTTDTTVLEHRPATITRLVPGASHCAAEQLGEIIPWMLQWLSKQLA